MKKKLLSIIIAVVMAVTIIPTAFAAPIDFTDVPDSHPNKVAIEFCAHYNFVNGKTDTTFSPDETITREQLALIWARTFQARKHNFGDVQKITSEADNSIIMNYTLGYINGVSDKKFDRKSSLTREMAAAIAYRTYIPGVDGEDMYKDYADYESMSSWAIEGISGCLKKGLFDGVVDGRLFKPHQAITRGEICQMIYNLMKDTHTYTVTVAEIVGGTVTASAKTAVSGQKITVTVTPYTGMKLKDGTLKYNDVEIKNNAFVMPEENVVIKAEFEPVTDSATITGIAISQMPDKTEYTVGEKLDYTGLEITATYSDKSTKIVTDLCTFMPAEGTTLETVGAQDVTVLLEGNTTMFTVVTGEADSGPNR